MGAWGCPHELVGACRRIKGRACDPGMKGCILAGRFVWSVEEKNRPARPPAAVKAIGAMAGARPDDAAGAPPASRRPLGS